MEVDLSRKGLTTLDGVEFPKELKYLFLRDNELTTVDGIQFPKGLLWLSLSQNRLTSLDDVVFPKELRKLWVYQNKLTSLDWVHFPEGLDTISLSDAQLKSFDGLYVSPRTTLLSGIFTEIPAHEIRSAVRKTCAGAILRAPHTKADALQAWAFRLSYLLGGVAFWDYDDAFYKTLHFVNI